MASGSSPVSSRKRPKWNEVNEYAKTTLKTINQHLVCIFLWLGKKDKEEEIRIACENIIKACDRCEYQEFKDMLKTLTPKVKDFTVSMDKDTFDRMMSSFNDCASSLQGMSHIVRHTQVKKQKKRDYDPSMPNLSSETMDSVNMYYYSFFQAFMSAGSPPLIEQSFKKLRNEIKDERFNTILEEIGSLLFDRASSSECQYLVRELGKKIKEQDYQSISDLRESIKRDYPGGSDYSWSIKAVMVLRQKGERCFLMKSKDYYFVRFPKFGDLNLIEPLENCFYGEIVDENDEAIKVVKEIFENNLWIIPSAAGEYR